MEENINIIEIGASSMMDVIQTKSWTKLFNNHAPKWGIPLQWRRWNELNKEYNVVVVSMGSKKKQDESGMELSLEGFLINPAKSPIWNSCVTTPSFILKGLLDAKKESSKMLIVYLDSLSALTNVPYPTSVEYSISKVAMSTYVKNLTYIYPNVKTMDMHIGSVKTRMCNHGMDSEEVAMRIIRDISDAYEYFDEIKKYESFTIDDERQEYQLTHGN